MAKRRCSRSISLLLPFPDDTTESGDDARETSAFYMHCELDKGEIQNVHNAYMSTHAFAIDAQNAPVLRDDARVLVITAPAALTPVRTVTDLLAAISTRPEWAKHQSMMRTTVGHLTTMLGQAADAIPVGGLPPMVAKLKDYLYARHYRRNAARSYIHYLRLLIRAAAELGAKAVPPEIPAGWQPVYAAAQACKCGSVVRFAVEKGIEPGAFGDAELERWAEAVMAAGLSHSRSKVVKHLFRKAVFNAKLNTLMPGLTRRNATPMAFRFASFHRHCKRK